MQYELYMMKKIVALLDNGLVLSDLDSDTRKDFPKIVLEKTMDNEETADEIRNLVCLIATKYGVLGSLKKLKNFRDDLTNMRLNGQGEDTILVSLPLGHLYDMLERAYSVSVAHKVLVAFSKMSEGTFETEEFLNSIVKETVPARKVLDIEKPHNEVQISWFNEEEAQNDSLDGRMKAYWTIEHTMNELRALLKENFDSRTIVFYCSNLVDILSCSPSIEHKIISRIISQIIGPELVKSSKSKKAKDEPPLFSKVIKPLRDERWGMRCV